MRIFYSILICLFLSSSLSAITASFSPSVLTCGSQVVTGTFDCTFTGGVLVSINGDVETDASPLIPINVVNGQFTFNVTVGLGDQVTFVVNCITIGSTACTGSTTTNNTLSHDCVGPSNDFCVNAIELPITQNSCTDIIFDRTNSSLTAGVNCGLPNYTDVWVKFVANAPVVTVDIGCVPGSLVYYYLYGDCGGSQLVCGSSFQLTPTSFALSNLTVGELYYLGLQTNPGNTSCNFAFCLTSPAASTTVPIELMSFNVVQDSDIEANISFSMGGLSDASYFEIQRKIDLDGDFEVISMVDDFIRADDIQDFELLDDHLEEGRDHYYRLKVMYLNGEEFLSDTKLLKHKNFDSQTNTVAIYPNPTKGTAFLEFNIEVENTNCKIFVQNMASKQMIQLESMDNISKGNHKVQLSLDRMPKGVNIVILKIGGEYVYKKLIKY